MPLESVEFLMERAHAITALVMSYLLIAFSLLVSFANVADGYTSATLPSEGRPQAGTGEYSLPEPD